MDKETSLVKVDAFRKALVEAETIPDVKNLRDQSEVFRQWLKKQRAGFDAQCAAVKMKLLAERELGRRLDAMEKNKGAEASGQNQYSVVPYHDDTAPTYSELGIDRRMNVHRWICEAQMTDEDF